MFKIAQLSDLHLLANPSEERWGLNPQACFDAVLALALQQQPDAFLLTGDLVHDETDTGYQRLADRMNACGLPTLAIPGNHDDPEKIQHYFGDAQLNLDGLNVIGINSHIRGSDCGYLGNEELNRAEALIQQSETPALLAVHHPPIEVGSHWIDELGLADSDALANLLNTHKDKILALVCGHVHQVFESTIHGIPVLTTPSTNRQFLPLADEFATEKIAAGFRLLHVDGNDVESQIFRLQ